MKKTWVIPAVIAGIIVIGVGGYFYFFSQDKETGERTVPVIVTEDNLDFKLEADSADALGVDVDTSFTLTSSKEVDLTVVEGNLAVTPAFEYQVRSSDSNTFEIVPQENLQENTVYNFSLVAQQAGEEQQREYQWAYQTKDSFKVMSTLPRDMATDVPVDSGIEVTFSHENYVNYENYFSVSPETAGHFEQYRKTLAFVPDALAAGTVYTVTIKAGLPLSGTDQTLLEDYQFQFETALTEQQTGYFNFTKDFFEYPDQEAPVVTVYEYNSGVSLAQVSVYAFGNFAEFTDAVKTVGLHPYWARYADRGNPYPTDSLTLQSTFSAEIKTADYQQYLEFPETVPEGYYLIQIPYGNAKAQAFLQIGELVASLQASQSNSFIWVHDLETQAPVANAAIRFSDGNQILSETDGDGLAQFQTPAAIEEDSDERLKGMFYFTVSDKGRNLLLPVENHHEFGGYYQTGRRDYWTYFYTNRTLYSPTDSVKFWGLVKPRESQQNLQEVEVQFTKFPNYYTSTAEEVIAKKTLPVSSYGTLEGSFDYQNLNPGTYYLKVAADGVTILSKYVEIATYTKPAYKIEVDTPNKAIFEGDDAVFNINAVFYDGTPVGNLELEYTGALGGGKITTDANGQANVVLATSYSDGYYPVYEYFSIHPVRAELSGIYTDAYVYAFGPQYAIEGEINDEGAISGNVDAVDLSKINALGDDFVWDYQGDPVSDVTVAVKVYHEYYTKTEIGTHYDYLNKKTYKTYDYQSHSDLVQELSAVTDSGGRYSAQINKEEGKNYKVEVSVNDPEGRKAVASLFLYGDARDFWWSQEGSEQYYLVTDGAQNGETAAYQAGDAVSISLYENEKIIPAQAQKSIVYFKGQVGLFDIAASEQSAVSFTVEESYAPNIYVYALYFDGRSYHLTRSEQIKYDTSARKLQIDISQNKESYRPGEEVTLQLKVTDPAGAPVKATVNVSAIDEALTAIQWANPANVLTQLYANIPTPILYSYQSHEKSMEYGAEGGGCFSGDTEILMAGGTTKAISQVSIGDLILTRQAPQSSKLVLARVNNVLKHTVGDYLVINGKLRVTPEHIVYLNNSWQPIGNAAVGDQLTGADGQSVKINSLIRRHELLTVYNLHVDRYHTFIADGIYVHNEKAGGRQNFQDIAFFGSTETDQNGNASVTFTLPDNITAWQTTVHAVTQDLKANAVQTAIIATQPYFVDVAAASDYLVGDQPKILIRSFGRELDSAGTVKYEISFPEYNDEIITQQAGADEVVAVDLPEFSAGQHAIRVQGQQGDLSDAVIKKFNYHDSNITQGTANYYRLEEGLAIKGAAEGQTTLKFTNLERGQFYSDLKGLTWSWGDRIEQQLGRRVAQSLLNEYFYEEATPPSVTFTDYQVPEGGIAILPYSSAELLLTAKVMEVAPDLFDTISAKEYFQSVLDNPKSNTDEVVYALLGLANLNEPVLTDINLLLANNEISPELKLYLARGIANLGATEYAATLLQDILNASGVAADPYLELQLGSTQDDYTEYSYQAAILAAAVSSDQAPKLYQYAVDHRAELQLNTLDRLAYLKTTLPLLSGEPVSFSYNLDGASQQVTLGNSESYALSVNPDQLANISFSDITGLVGVIAAYQQPQDPADIKTDSNLKISREYSVNGQAKQTFQENDIVKITLKPVINSKAIDTEYQITDYLPAGLKVLSNLQSRDLPYDQLFRYPYEVNGQAVKFWSGKPAQEFYYYAMVISKGGFIAESPAIQGFIAQSSVNCGSSSRITIE